MLIENSNLFLSAPVPFMRVVFIKILEDILPRI
jgi:hypothetical protein